MAKNMKKIRSYRELNSVAKKGQILFTGSSLMEMFPVAEYVLSDGLELTVYNRGIGGTTTDDFIEEIDTVLFDLAPAKLFINIGTNDINFREDGEPWQEHLLTNYSRILSMIQERLPQTKVYVMAYYPVNTTIPEAGNGFGARTNEAINDTNLKVRELAEKFGYKYIDVNDGIKDENGNLKAEYTIEGMHMYAGGYKPVYEALKPYILE